MRKSIVLMAILLMVFAFVSKDKAFGWGVTTHLNPDFADSVLKLEAFKQDVDKLVSVGGDTIRFNITMNARVLQKDENGQWSFDAAYLTQIKEALLYAEEKGIDTVLVINPCDAILGQGLTFEELKSEVYNIIKYIASELRDCGVDVWQVFNEADIHHFRNYGARPPGMDEGFQIQDAQSYAAYLSQLAELFDIAREAINTGIGTEATIAANVGGPQDKHRVAAWQQFYSVIANHVDILGLDIYGDPACIPAIVKVFEAMGNVWVMETGVAQINGMSEEQQADLLLKIFLACVESGVEKFLFYEMRDEILPDPDDPEGYFGILNIDGSPKLAFKVLAAAYAIRGLYNEILGREVCLAEYEGFKAWVDQLLSGVSLDRIREAFYNSEEYKQLSIREKIFSFYRYILGREPSEEEVGYWANEYNKGLSWSKIAQCFFASQEFRNKSPVEKVSALYRVVLGRDPDSEGLQFWVNAYRNGMSLREIVEAFLNSPEFNSKSAEFKDYIINKLKIREIVSAGGGPGPAKGAFPDTDGNFLDAGLQAQKNKSTFDKDKDTLPFCQINDEKEKVSQQSFNMPSYKVDNIRKIKDYKIPVVSSYRSGSVGKYLGN